MSGHPWGRRGQVLVVAAAGAAAVVALVISGGLWAEAVEALRGRRVRGEAILDVISGAL